MNTIYWTHKHFTGKEFETHEHYGRHCVVALAQLRAPDLYGCFTKDDNYIHMDFATKEEAVQFITQTCKPYYYSFFGACYDLQYLDNNSDEWYDIHAKWRKSSTAINELIEYIALPWYKKIPRVLMNFGSPVSKNNRLSAPLVFTRYN